MKLNQATIKSVGRGAIGVLVGVVLVLVKRPEFAPYAAILPFILRYVDPTEKEIGIGKDIADQIK